MGWATRTVGGKHVLHPIIPIRNAVANDMDFVSVEEDAAVLG